MYECFHCGCRSVIWQSDFDTEDIGLWPGGIVHMLTCTHCGADIQYVIGGQEPPEDEEGTDSTESEYA